MKAFHPSGSNHPANFSGHNGLRGAILLRLKRAHRTTAKDLAAQLRVSLNAVRNHLRDLESEGLIQYERRHHGVGAPAFEYRLTPAGDALFPRRYEATLNELLNHVVDREGRAAAVSILEARYASLTERVKAELAGAPPAARLAAVARLLSEDGYMAEASVSAQDAVLTEHNCAIHAVAERFPEICAAEARFLAAVLGAEVDRQEHILRGCSACEYRVRFNPSEGLAGASPSAEQAKPVTPTLEETV